MKITKFQYLNVMTYLKITMPMDWSFDKIQQLNFFKFLLYENNKVSIY
jgi:hypothetical protein